MERVVKEQYFTVGLGIYKDEDTEESYYEYNSFFPEFGCDGVEDYESVYFKTVEEILETVDREVLGVLEIVEFRDELQQEDIVNNESHKMIDDIKFKYYVKTAVDLVIDDVKISAEEEKQLQEALNKALKKAIKNKNGFSEQKAIEG
ncbi:hypothetical protein K5E_11120 [Enterococcus thailandicus]|uniref:hypothetical protein n=1 Tax=Enterococcus thailandicus TaxID=417368 RepID=UPI00244D9275|nr:hypothetical protein [Enterococcus thailandicus]GMC02590.1 hypothetical protein K4E_01000 [Enterococcus thailandicus]GMC08973.1 hypothetical protein K5E_11120 [Enterococcus thailandicus]